MDKKIITISVLIAVLFVSTIGIAVYYTGIVNDKNTQITSMNTQIASLNTQITSLNSQINSLNSENNATNKSKCGIIRFYSRIQCFRNNFYQYNFFYSNKYCCL